MSTNESADARHGAAKDNGDFGDKVVRRTSTRKDTAELDAVDPSGKTRNVEDATEDAAEKPVSSRAMKRTLKAERKAAQRTADLQFARVDPWSVLKYTFVLSIFGFLVWMVMAYLLFQGVERIGLIDSVKALADSLFKEDARTVIYSYLTFGSAMKLAAFVGGAVAILSIVIGTIMAFVHNIVSWMTGGVTMSLRTRQK